ncbi:structural protein [Pseudomonas caspiana]
MSKIPRGLRNNNPGNIDFNKANDWLGQLPFDPLIESRFARFDKPENGIRALGKLLRNYRTKYGLDTVKGLINRWAPSNENDTAAYVAAVESRIVKATGKPAGKLDLNSPVILGCLVRAIIQHENGSIPYSDAVIDEGVRRALA